MYENNLCDEAIELGGSIWFDNHSSFKFGIREHNAIEKDAWMFSREYEKEYGDDCLECERFKIAKKYKMYYSRDKLSCKKCGEK